VRDLIADLDQALGESAAAGSPKAEQSEKQVVAAR